MTLRTRSILAGLAITGALVFAACGEAPSDEDQIRSTVTEFAHAVADDNLVKACSLTAGDKSDCLGTMTLAKTFVGEKSLVSVMKSLKITKVQVAPDGKTATYWSTSDLGKGDAEGDRMVKRDGKWLLDIEEDKSSEPTVEPEVTVEPTPEPTAEPSVAPDAGVNQDVD